MRPRTTNRLLVVAVAVALVAIAATAMIRSQHPSSVALAKPRISAGSHSARDGQGRPKIASAIATFSSSYASYLNGAPARVIKDASLTAVSQVTQEGQIPAGLRDGALRVSSEGLRSATCCSAAQTVVLTNRQESYPFTVTVLDDGSRGWQVAGLVPVDLAMDRRVKPVTGFRIPAAAKAAARAFAIAYTAYRAGVGSEPAALTTAAALQIAHGQDSLAQAVLPKAHPQLVATEYGPPSGREFAATATVIVGTVRTSFTFLMQPANGIYKAAAFL